MTKRMRTSVGTRKGICEKFHKLPQKQRMGGDSNPRYLSVNTLSRRARSTTLPPILCFEFRFRVSRNTAANGDWRKRDVQACYRMKGC